VHGNRIERDIYIERRNIRPIFEVNDQPLTIENCRPIEASTGRKVSAMLLLSLTLIDTDIDGLRRNVLPTSFLGQESVCRNEDASRPIGISAFPWTLEGLQVTRGNLRLKWVDDKIGTDGHY
jgi:hypothetical protein